jgi:hypothetical protein
MNDPLQDREERENIVRHLRSCDGCRTLFEEMQHYYDGVQKELSSNPDLGRRRKKEIMQQSPLPELWSRPVATMIPRRSVPTLAHVLHFTRRHPVFAGGGFGLFVIMIFSFTYYLIVPAIDNGPYDYRLDDDMKMLQIVNKRNKVLWETSWFGNHNINEWAGSQNINYCVLVDIDRDGKNDVITIVPELGKKRSERNIVSAYKSDGTLLWERGYGAPVTYRGQEYPNDYAAKDLTIRVRGETVEIFLMVVHNHSPSFIFRINSTGDVIGSYLHMGHFSGIQIMDADGDGDDDLVACGVNDELDRPAIVVLDPDKIVGETEAITTRGFGKTPSNAELISLIVDSVPDDKVFRTVFLPGVQLREKKLIFRYSSNEGVVFSVAFALGMKLYTVNETDQGRKSFGDNILTKKENIIKNIKYWDGKSYAKTKKWSER